MHPADSARALLTSAGAETAELITVATAGGVPLVGVPVRPQRAAELWSRLRARHGETGLWPFLSDGPRRWERWFSRAPGGPDRLASALAQALAAAPPDVVAELIAAQRTRAVEDARASQQGGDAEFARYCLGLFDVDETLRLMATEPATARRRMHSELAGASWDPGWLWLAPAHAGYELPVLLSAPYANCWQGSPSHETLTPADHAGVLRSWQRRFGAEVRYLSHCALGLVVAQPPADQREFARAAVEQFAYCDDLSQVLGDTHDVARLQVPTGYWYFWWD
jgi:Domain of unknown function (DUF4253)